MSVPSKELFHRTLVRVEKVSKEFVYVVIPAWKGEKSSPDLTAKEF